MRTRIGCLIGAALLVAAGPAVAKSKSHRKPQARPHYNYALAHPVREGFRDAAAGRAFGRQDYYAVRENYAFRSGPVVDTLRGDFTGGVGHGGGDYFIDGYGQTHFFVGSFRTMNRLPHGPYGPQRFGPGRRF